MKETLLFSSYYLPDRLFRLLYMRDISVTPHLRGILRWSLSLYIASVHLYTKALANVNLVF